MSGLKKDKNPVNTRLVIPSRNFYQTPLLFLYPVLSEDALKQTSFCQGEEEKRSPSHSSAAKFFKPPFSELIIHPSFHLPLLFNIKHL